MCVGCDIGQLYPYLDKYFIPHEKAGRQMKQVEKGLLELSKLSDIHYGHRPILDKHHKRLLRIRREWGKAHHTLAKDIADYDIAQEKEKARIAALPYGEAVQG